MRIPVSKAYVRPLQAGVIILVVTNVILTLLWIIQCSLLQAAWDLDLKERSTSFSKGQLQRIIMAQAKQAHAVWFAPFSSSKPFQKITRMEVLTTGTGVSSKFSLASSLPAFPRFVQGTSGPKPRFAAILAHTFRATTRFSKSSKELRQAQHLEVVKVTRHLTAHPANVYSDPPMLLGSQTTTAVGSLFSGELAMPSKAQIRRSTQTDIESQREVGSPTIMEDEEDGIERRASLDVDLEARFSLDRVDQSLERIDPAILKTIDDARK
ncbi:MAG: hypothetical protein Q9170_004410 [Blastenia crenularia]